jgi:hypothetical protein
MWCLLLGLCAVNCEDEYSLAPTFCDDWCHATLISTCDEDPEDCVENCELTKASDACFPRQTSLLRCYEGADRTAFTCAGMGFRSEIRVRPDVCSAERDALFECESPGIGQCLTLCRTAQQQQVEQVALGQTGLLDFRRLTADAGSQPSCPALDRPCEESCWSVFGLQSAGLAELGLVPEADDLEGALSCLQATLIGCFGDALGEALGPIADAGPPNPFGPPTGPPGESISSAIARCGGAITLD